MRLYASFFLLVLSVSVPPMQAQTSAPKHLAFEVVSIRRDTSPASPLLIGAQPGVTTAPDGFRCKGPLIFLFQVAYAPDQGQGFLDLRRIEGYPDWLFSFDNRYEVIAKVADEDLPQWQDPAKRPAMMQEMVRTLLTERVKPTVHMESREMPVYELVVAKGGPKLQAAETMNTGELHQKYSIGMESPGGGMVIPSRNPGELQFYAVSMPALAEHTLSLVAGRPVLDKTGLKGRYDLRLIMPPPQTATVSAESENRPSIFTAVQEQLGLKLVSAKGPVPTLVIDHVERPTEN